ncbi:MAG: hypothetical protein EXR72_00400 [Myxococcales bacterium]|nr:hypothetical protein [Myxococcales bacterium]
MKRARLAFALLLLPLSARAQIKTFTTDVDFDAGQLVQVAHPPANQIQLGPTPVTKTTNVWACHTTSSMVVRIDTNTGKQTGRYDAALQFINGVPTGADAPLTATNYPRRVAVDNAGDVWISNGAFGGGRQGTLSKFSGLVEHCIDRNHNGKIDTSVDANNDGIIDTNNGAEYFGQNDECILTTIKIGAVGATPRGVAVDRNGKVWVSENQCVTPPCKLYRFNPAEPVALEKTVSVDGNPYSMASGGQYVFYGHNGGGITGRIDIDTLAVEYIKNCPAFYGALVAHPNGNTSWYGNSSGGLIKADWVNKTCTNLGGPPIYTVSLDKDFNVWAGHAGGAYVVKWPAAGGAPIQINTVGPYHGVSVDFAGFVWFNGYGGNYNVTKVDPIKNTVLANYRYDCPNCPNPKGIDYSSYLYSDFTGYQVNRQAPYTYFGTWNGTFDGGGDGIPWSKVVYNQEGQGGTPCDNANNRCTTLKMFVRAADDPKKLPTVGFTPVQNGAALKGIVGRYVEVEADLNGPGYLTPVLSDVQIVGPCGQGFGDSCCIKPADCDDKNPCTIDVCPSPAAQCKHTAKASCCAKDADCNDKNACTTDKCPVPGGMCTNAKIANCCNIDGDCGDGNLCTEDKCSGVGGACSHPPLMGCCNSNADCEDGNSCTIDLCSGPGGTCGHFAKFNCCNVDADCDDMNVCTGDKCSGPGGTCAHAQKIGCCNVDDDCDDQIVCSDDKCSGPGGMCSHAPKANCCKDATECDDKDACTANECIKGACGYPKILRCCNQNAECNDQDVCTTDSCTGAGGSCAHARVPGCCSIHSDCDDHDPCTDDTCSAPGGACNHAPRGAGCCKLDSDCDDQNTCTSDRCNGGAACDHSSLANCYCNTDNECPGEQRCIDHACQTPRGDGGAQISPNFGSAAGTFGACSAAPGRPASVPLLFGLLLVLVVAARARTRGMVRR